MTRTASRDTLIDRNKNLKKRAEEAETECEMRGLEMARFIKSVELTKDQLPEFFKNMVKPVVDGYNQRCTKQKA